MTSPSVVTAFPTLIEAQIACGALRAAGFDAEVLDENFGRVLAVDLLGGFRITVQAGEYGEAKSFLEAIARSTLYRKVREQGIEGLGEDGEVEAEAEAA